MKNVLQRKYLVLWAAGLLFGVFLLGATVYTGNIKSRKETQAIRYLQEATSQRKAAITHGIEGDFKTLRGLASGLSAMDAISEESLKRFLKDVAAGNDFMLLGYAAKDGAITLAYSEPNWVDVARLSHLQRCQSAMEGEEIHTSALDEGVLGGKVNYYAVPVWKNNEIKGMFFAAHDDALLREHLSVPVYRGSGYFAIFDAQGCLVSPGLDPVLSMREGESIRDITCLSETEWETARQIVQSGEQNGATIYIREMDQLLTLQPLGYNNWAIASVVEQDLVSAEYNSLYIGALVLTILSSSIVIGLMLWQIHTTAKTHTQLEKLAYGDPITGGPNYTKFLLDAERMLADNPQRRLAVWTVDTKNFSRINNVFGNEKGDMVLRRVYDVLNLHDSKQGLHCRIGGDIFTGIRRYREKEELENWFWQVIEALADRKVIASSQMLIDYVMGVYCVDEFEQILSVNAMVNRASLARKSVKGVTGNAVTFFTMDMERRQRHLTELEASGRDALRNAEITFFLQPKVALGKEFQIAGAEALARWKHPRYGWISPGVFIPLFESDGFIVELDRSIFEQVCKWFSESSDQIKQTMRISINVSRQGMVRSDFVEFYTSVKERYHIADGALELEFTESVLVDEYDSFREAVKRLQERGFICSIDDFGSGYSSLNVLKNLPIDVLKLDARFFSDEGDQEREYVVIEHFIRMARLLSIETVAEGVETSDRVRFLQEKGCDMVQGYIFSKPLSCSDFDRLVQTTQGMMVLQTV